MYLPKTKPTTRGSRQHGKLCPGTVCDLTPSARRRRRKFSPRRTFWGWQNARCEHGVIESLHTCIQSHMCGQRAHLLTMFMIIVRIFFSPRSKTFFGE